MSTDKLKIWASILEETAAQQLEDMTKLPFIFKHIAVMPDVHAGYGSTVGSVIATTNALIPSCVGVDIGCGMIAGKTNLKLEDLPDSLKDIRLKIELEIPTGFSKYLELDSYAEKHRNFLATCPLVDEVENTALQCGTLGGGNHFIELCKDTKDFIWVMLHSGSRKIGHSVAETYIKKAKQIMDDYLIQIPNPDLAYLPEKNPTFHQYVRDMLWCQEYALKNREVMFEKVINILKKELRANVDVDFKVNCHHNYTELENHFGKNVWVTRKGAVRARKDDYGIIPGSMGAKSYIVKGKGNVDSFCSCSHGAGRVMSRTKAKNIFTIEDFESQTQGVECSKNSKFIDEIPAAYKDIDQVMEDQKDLVEIVEELKQILCVKG